MEGENSEVVSDVIEVIREKEDTEFANDLLQNALENANASQEAAIQTAEQIAAAAMESTRGQEIAALREEIHGWQDRFGNLEIQFQALQSSLTEMTGQMSALALLQMTPDQQTVLSSSIPPQSEVEEAITEVQQILPESLSNVVDQNLAAPEAPVRKARRWI